MEVIIICVVPVELRLGDSGETLKNLCTFE